MYRCSNAVRVCSRFASFMATNPGDDITVVPNAEALTFVTG